MSTYNPRMVAQALEDLESEITRWSSMASEMLETAADSQRHAKEGVDRAFHSAAVMLEGAIDEEESVEKADAAVVATIEKCANATATAQDTLKEAQNVFLESKTTLQKWQMELENAIAWVSRAETRLKKALQQLDSAQRSLKRRELILSQAEARLRDCRSGLTLTRWDCSGEAAAVSRAGAEITRALKRVRAAEQVVIATQEEVERAKARIACCKRADAFSTEAVHLAQECVNTAAQAVNSAERGLEFAHAIERCLRVAQEKMLAEVESAQNMMAEIKKAQEFTDEGAIHLRTAGQAEDAAQIYVTSVQKELTHRIEQLLELNNPAVLEPGDWSLPKNVSPSEIKIYPPSDEKNQINYGNKRDKTGQTVGEHGNTVMDESDQIDYARTQRGTIKKDIGNKRT